MLKVYSSSPVKLPFVQLVVRLEDAAQYIVGAMDGLQRRLPAQLGVEQFAR